MTPRKRFWAIYRQDGRRFLFVQAALATTGEAALDTYVQDHWREGMGPEQDYRQSLWVTPIDRSYAMSDATGKRSDLAVPDVLYSVVGWRKVDA